MITKQTYGTLIERIKKFIENGWPTITFTSTDNEILLYVYEAVGQAIVTASNQGLQIDGIRSLPEGYITEFSFDMSVIPTDVDTNNKIIDLPAPPVSLPLGYSISAPYFTGLGSSSYPLIAIESHTRGYALKLPTPNFGVYYYIQGSKMNLVSPSAADLSSFKLKVPMMSPRSQNGSMDDQLNIPDDQMGPIFDTVTNRLIKKHAQPKDNVNDGIARKSEQ